MSGVGHLGAEFSTIVGSGCVADGWPPGFAPLDRGTIVVRLMGRDVLEEGVLMEVFVENLRFPSMARPWGGRWRRAECKTDGTSSLRSSRRGGHCASVGLRLGHSPLADGRSPGNRLIVHLFLLILAIRSVPHRTESNRGLRATSRKAIL
jgi:hypothetical protein